MSCEYYLLLCTASACRKQVLRQIKAKSDCVIDCVFLPAHAISRAGYTQSVCGLLGREKCRVGTLRSRKALFEEEALTSVPALVEFAVGSGGGNGDGRSSSSPARSTALSLESEAHSAVSSPRGAGSALLLSSSKEVDVESVEYLPPQFPTV